MKVKPWLSCEVDRVRGLVAVRGEEARRTLTMLTGQPPKWSEQARAFLGPAGIQEDVQAFGWYFPPGLDAYLQQEAMVKRK